MTGDREGALSMRGEWRSGRTLWLALAPLVLVAMIAWRAATEPVPRIAIRPALVSYVRLGHGLPALAWPGGGEAAVELEGADGTAQSRGVQRPVPIASVAKVMTAFVTLTEHPLSASSNGFTMKVTGTQVAEEHERVALDQSVLPVHAGERITERQALRR